MIDHNQGPTPSTIELGQVTSDPRVSEYLQSVLGAEANINPNVLVFSPAELHFAHSTRGVVRDLLTEPGYVQSEVQYNVVFGPDESEEVSYGVFSTYSQRTSSEQLQFVREKALIAANRKLKVLASPYRLANS